MVRFNAQKLRLNLKLATTRIEMLLKKQVCGGFGVSAWWLDLAHHLSIPFPFLPNQTNQENASVVGTGHYCDQYATHKTPSHPPPKRLQLARKEVARLLEKGKVRRRPHPTF